MSPIAQERIGEYIKTAMRVLSDNGGPLRAKEVVQAVGNIIVPDDYELVRYEKSGQVRWETFLQFYSVSCVKAGWMEKTGGMWYLTEAGKSVLNLSDKALFDESETKYYEWKESQITVGKKDNPPDSDAWLEFTKWGRLFFEWEQFDSTERAYKLEIAEKLNAAREAFLDKDESWTTLLRRAFGTPNNLTPWRVHQPFLEFVEGSPTVAQRALLEIWKPSEDLISYQNAEQGSGNLNPNIPAYASERLENFIEVLSEIAGASNIRFNMLEVLGSFLLMGVDSAHCPIYRADPLNKAYRLTNESPPGRGATAVAKYERGISFLVDVMENCSVQGLELRDIVDAQSIVWCITKGDPPNHWDDKTKADFLQYRGDKPVGPVPINEDLDYWIVGPYVGDMDQTRRFIDEGVWENAQDIHSELVREMKIGDRIAIRTRGTQTRGLPFDNLGNTVSKIQIKAIGTISENLGDGRFVRVDWEEPEVVREWYFYTLIRSIWRLPKDRSEMARQLIRFVFFGESQDYSFFVDMWWGEGSVSVDREIETPTPYSVDDVIKDGVFLSLPEVELIIRRLETKRNVILQGAPGVGKTFVTRKLAYALMGLKDDGKITTIQLHPSYSYEDFVRGYRPTDEAGRFEMRDGPFLRICETAYGDPDNRYVMIIDEINRGNLSQVFGEMFSLLESDKRGRAHAITPLYMRNEFDTVSVPENLYIIGTMNLADRSLALVDYALRRRFAFITLEPKFKDMAYRGWLIERGMDEQLVDKIINSMTTLNDKISDDRQLGRAYQIGHSFFCPPGNEFSNLDTGWFEEIISTEIKPLVEEYWFDEPEKVKTAFNEVFE